MAVWKPKTSRYYFCRFNIGERGFSGTTGKTTKADAKAFEREWKKDELRKIEALGGGKSAIGGMAFLEAANKYFEKLSEGGVKIDCKKMAVLERKLDWLVDKVGPTTKLADIDDEFVAKLVAIRRKDHRFGCADKGNVGNGSLNQDIIVPLSAILNAARGWKVALPWKPKFKRFVIKPRERELSLSEEFRMEEHAGDYRDILEFALLSGLRREELFIEWKDVIWEHDRIRVRVKGGELREVVITPGIRRILEANHRRHHVSVFTVRDENLVTGQTLPERPADGQARPITYTSLYRAFVRICEKAVIDDLTIHDLRRTAGARKYRLTGDLGLVQTFLHHKSIAMTRRHYVHIKLNDVSDRIVAAEIAFQAVKDDMKLKFAA